MTVTGGRFLSRSLRAIGSATACRVQDDQGNRGGAGHEPADGRSAPLEHGRKLGLNGTHALTKFAVTHSSDL
jgi:hypothetical protein